MLVSTVTLFLNGSRGASVGENENSVPEPTGVHLEGFTPFGMYRKLSLGTALVVAAKAGVIASSIGKASVAPAARRKLRRSSDIFFRNIVTLLIQFQIA